MESLRKFLGISPPQKHNDGYYHWDPYGNAHDGNETFEYSPGNPNYHHGNVPNGLEAEIMEMERQFQEIFAPFGGQRGFFSEFGPRFFGDEHSQQVPTLSPGPKADVELDNKALNGETLLAIMEEDKQNRKHPNQIVPRTPRHPSPFSDFPKLPPEVKNFSRSVSIQSTRRPDGTWETRKVVKDSDGNEQVTVSEHPTRDGPPTSTFTMRPDFGTDTDNFEPSEHNHRGTSIFDKMFGGF